MSDESPIEALRRAFADLDAVPIDKPDTGKIGPVLQAARRIASGPDPFEELGRAQSEFVATRTKLKELEKEREELREMLGGPVDVEPWDETAIMASSELGVRSFQDAAKRAAKRAHDQFRPVILRYRAQIGALRAQVEHLLARGSAFADHPDTILTRQEAATKTGELFYIVSERWSDNGCTVTFWRAQGKGYTICLEWAGKYTEKEVVELTGGDSFGVPCEVVDQIGQSVVRMELLPTLRARGLVGCSERTGGA